MKVQNQEKFHPDVSSSEPYFQELAKNIRKCDKEKIAEILVSIYKLGFSDGQESNSLKRDSE